jgi:nucleotide-binding universal stress UspA family protein
MTGNTNIEIKHVILPYDFSNAAKNALQHALSIAKKFRADLTLLSVMDSYSSQCLQYKGSKFAEFEGISKEKLNEQVKQLFTFNKIECQVVDTKWSKAVHQLADQRPGSILVLGIGGKGRDGFFDASHAYRNVDALNIPMLAVKENHVVSDYKTITTPLDETFHTREKLPYVTLLASAFDAKVSVVGLQTHTDKDSTNHMQAIMRQASQYVQIKVKAYQDKLVTSKNEVNDLVKTASEDKADLMVIMSSHEKSLSNLFSGPYAQQVTDKATTPILICPIRVSLVMGAVSI